MESERPLSLRFPLGLPLIYIKTCLRCWDLETRAAPRSELLWSKPPEYNRGVNLPLDVERGSGQWTSRRRC